MGHGHDDEHGLGRLAVEQAALRRVATLVAHEAAPEEVFAAVAEEVARVLEVPLTSVVRYESDGTATQVGAWGQENPFRVGTRWTLDERSVSAAVARTGQPARVGDYAEIGGDIAAALREVGIRSALGAPIVVAGRLWGAMMALSAGPMPLPAGTEARLAEFTELVATAISNAQARDDLRRLADEQAALRRVATLVARGADSRAIFDAVAHETGPLIGATSVNLAHFAPDGHNVTMAGWSVRDTHVPTGTRLPIPAGTINAIIRETAEPARVDSYEEVSGDLAAVIRRRGIRSEVGAPVIVEGRLWGALIAGTDRADPLPAGTERRVARFAELIATAVANATARSDLVASRARIVAAADEARRRIQRDLHDGTQQRLVTLSLELRALRSAIPAEMVELRSALDHVEEEVAAALADVREISRGLHPAILSQLGLGPALRSLSARSPVPVELDVTVSEGLPPSFAIAAYYVVSEALANVAKHAQASHVRVSVTTSENRLRVSVRDDGVGGADSSAGSGLIGLEDRVAALGGRLALTSPAGQGTSISVELPLIDSAEASALLGPPSPESG
jgi:signal transduction histidine kinase